MAPQNLKYKYLYILLTYYKLKFSACFKTMKTLKKWGQTALFPFTPSAIMTHLSPRGNLTYTYDITAYKHTLEVIQISMTLYGLKYLM